MAASISSGIGGTMVFSASGRFSVMVATGGSVLYSRVSNWGVVGMPEVLRQRATAATASVIGVSPEMSSKRLPGGARLVQNRDEHRCDIFAGNAPAARRFADRHAPGARVVGEAARTHDGRAQRGAGPDRFVGSPFRAQIRLEDRIVSGGLRVGGHPGDHQIPIDSCGFGCVRQQDGRVPIDGLLARRPAARPRARGEHDGVGAAHMFSDLVDRGLLQVDDYGLGTGRFEVRGLRRRADEPCDGVATLRKQAFEDQRDLAVSACDDDAHAVRCYSASAGGGSGRRLWWLTARSCRRS